jgi:hypothetical protein
MKAGQEGNAGRAQGDGEGSVEAGKEPSISVVIKQKLKVRELESIF